MLNTVSKKTILFSGEIPIRNKSSFQLSLITINNTFLPGPPWSWEKLTTHLRTLIQTNLLFLFPIQFTNFTNNVIFINIDISCQEIISL